MFFFFDIENVRVFPPLRMPISRLWPVNLGLVPTCASHTEALYPPYSKTFFFSLLYRRSRFGGFIPLIDAFRLSCSNPFSDLTRRDIPLRVRPTWTPCPGRSTQCTTRCSGRPATWPETAITATRLSVGAATAWRTILRGPPSRRLARTRRPSTPKLFLHGHGKT